MNKINGAALALLLLAQNTSAEPKIVGLVPARNEAHIIAQCLRALSLYTDAIVYLDDASEDDSVEIVESLAESCHIENIITKATWYRDEPGDRNKLLEAGRAIGGTHFIVIDADELFTANCLDDNMLRNQILALNPGDVLRLNWIQLWRSVFNYRFDNSVWTWNYKDFIFADDGQCSYSSEFIHTRRTPNLCGNVYTIQGYTFGVMHFQFVNWNNLLIKQHWYKCLEKVRTPQKPDAAINERYRASTDETNLGLQPSPYAWFANYPFFSASVYALADTWRKQQVNNWFEQFGPGYFSGLAIWDIDWSL